MELPEAVGNDLALITDLSDAGFKALALGVFKVLVGAKEEEAVVGDAALSDSNPAELKRAYAALTAAVLEATRVDLDEAGFVALIEDNGVVSERAVAAGQGYAKYRDSLRSELAKTTFGFPRVVGVEWRIDYVVKSRHLEKNYKPGYIVTLHTIDKQGQPKDITFACSVEELTDLVENLRDASKQVARIVKTAS